MSDNKQVKAKKKVGRPKRHGGYSLLTRGQLPENRRYLRHYLSEIRAGLVNDLADSEQDLSTAQLILIDRIITYLGVIRLIEEHAKDHGVLDSKGRPTSGLTGHYLTFNRQVREMLSLLGIERKELTQEPTLVEILKEHEESKKDKL